MTTVTIKGFICALQFDWDREPRYTFCTSPMDTHGYVTVMPHEFEVEVPTGFNMTAAQVASLEKTKEKLRDEFNSRVAELNEQISKLQALPYEAPEAA